MSSGNVRKAAVDALCSAPTGGGGFNYALRVNPEDPYSVDGSIDTTGPVLAALAPYQAEEKTAGVIERALAFLKANQNVETAGFGFMGSDSAETISMAIVGLTALRIDPCGPEYVKNGKTMLDALLTFCQPGWRYARMGRQLQQLDNLSIAECAGGLCALRGERHSVL